MKRRSLLPFVIALLAAAFGGSATAQDGAYPTKPITIVVPAPAGGTTDVVARIIQRKLGDILKQPFIIDNRAGASGVIGTQYALKAPKDGYTLILISPSLHTFVPSMVEKMPFDPIEDLTLISRINAYPYVMMTSPNQPFASLGELVKASRQPGSKFSYGSFGEGTAPHLITEWIRSSTGLDAVHVPYKGGAQTFTDLVSGELTSMVNSLPSVSSQIKAGQVKAIAVTSIKRDPMFPNVPTVAETIPGFEATGWLGLAATKGLPPAVVVKLQGALDQAAKDPVFIQQLKDLGGAVVLDNDSKSFHAFMLAEKAKWNDVVQKAKIKKMATLGG